MLSLRPPQPFLRLCGRAHTHSLASTPIRLARKAATPLHAHAHTRAHAHAHAHAKMNSSSMSSSESASWIELHCRKRGNKYLCEVEESYIEDAFNLFGLRSSVSNYSKALSLILDDEEDEIQSVEQYKKINKSAERLYGYIHARYIITSRGLSRMCQKYQRGDFGHCASPGCHHHPLLPMGTTDIIKREKMRLLCPSCEETFAVENTTLDGAYFGTSWVQMLFFTFPETKPAKYPTKYTPRVFGYKVHRSAWSVGTSSSAGPGRAAGGGVQANGQGGSIVVGTVAAEGNMKLVDEYRKVEAAKKEVENNMKVD
eukprot:comp16376_c0_seq1/m.14230 comp16376_c0_seq1/g.14230  ORF comp16376_c0_seq1/g.14230 comp16376_c0_seq1/m.14230 type:complete len:313 (-) comp16376_c0_seq1:6-944(-)